jgi:Family of unknown function (DUF6444)
VPEPLPSSVEELAGLIIELRAANADLLAQLAAQAEELAELKRRLGKDSSTSNKPPSSDPPYRTPEPLVAALLGAQAGSAARCAGFGDAAGRQSERDHLL